MLERRGKPLVSLRPRAGQNYICQDHSVFVTGDDGFVREDRSEGLLIYQTRTISHYCYLINGEPPRAVALSPVQENSWMGYYTAPPPGSDGKFPETLELRLSRFAGHGLHEEVDLTNHTQRAINFTLALEVDADFRDQSEMSSGHNSAPGSLHREWRENDGRCELFF